MIHFECDYTEGVHPLILDRLVKTNMEQTAGYGLDEYCESARTKIRKVFECPSADVHFLTGGTQTNMTMISALLRPWQGVLAPDTAHIACHETGAIEASGHKVLTLPSSDGKISSHQILDYCKNHYGDASHEHIVQPGMVYISYPTENGSLYSKKELEDIYDACRRCRLPFYIDGARLGYGLTSPECDMKPSDLARLCDVFYIGGTKCGALFGEAVVIVSDALKKDFRYIIKQKGGMLAKGRMLGIQFDTLFENNLYFDICRQAVDKALVIRGAFKEQGIPLYGSSATNQQFVLLTDEQMSFFSTKYTYEIWGKYDQLRTIVRFCTSWATTEANVRELIKDIKTL